MRVLNVNVILDPITGGGTAERTYQLSKALVEAGAECTILTTDIGLSPERIKSLGKVEVVALPCISRRFFRRPLFLGQNKSAGCRSGCRTSDGALEHVECVGASGCAQGGDSIRAMPCRRAAFIRTLGMDQTSVQSCDRLQDRA